MENKPLVQLISGRGFNQYQNGLRSRFAAYGLIYKLIYSEINDDPSMRLDFTSPLHTGRVTIWESGQCHLEVLEVTSGKMVFEEHHHVKGEPEFHKVYPRLTEYMRDALGWPQ